MGTYIVTVPDIADDDLIYDEAETRQILGFFYPGRVSQIATMRVDNETRRLAQTMLIAAIDGSYAMGFIQDLFETVTSVVRKPSRSLKSLGKKLAQKLAKRWFKHATKSDLADVKIYNAIRLDIANNLLRRFEELFDDSSAKLKRKGGIRLHLIAARKDTRVWG